MTFHVNAQNGFSIESSTAMNTLEFLNFFILFHIGWISVRIFRILKQLIFQIIIFKYQRIVKEDNTGYGGSFHSEFQLSVPCIYFPLLIQKNKNKPSLHFLTEYITNKNETYSWNGVSFFLDLPRAFRIRMNVFVMMVQHLLLFEHLVAQFTTVPVVIQFGPMTNQQMGLKCFLVGKWGMTSGANVFLKVTQAVFVYLFAIC